MTFPSGWRKRKLGDCVELLTGFAFPSNSYAIGAVKSIRLLRGDNVMQGFLRWDDEKRWQVPIVNGLERYQLRLGDIVIAMDRPVTKAGLFAPLLSFT